MGNKKPKTYKLSVSCTMPPDEIDAKLIRPKDGAQIPGGYTFQGNVHLGMAGTYMLWTKTDPAIIAASRCDG